jgi:hypothetical protein
VTLIAEAELGGQAREVGVSAHHPFHRGAHPQPHPVAGDRVTGLRAEDAAQVVRRHR